MVGDHAVKVGRDVIIVYLVARATCWQSCGMYVGIGSGVTVRKSRMTV